MNNYSARSNLNHFGQSGIGLIELMVSMVIGLFIMAGVVQMFSTTTQNSVANAGASRIQENIRYAFSRIATDIAQSGNLGCFSTSVAAASFKDPYTNMLVATTGGQYDFTSIVDGTDSPSNAPDDFRLRYVNNSVRYDVTAVTPNSVTVSGYVVGDVNQGDVVAVSNCSEGVVFMVTNSPLAIGEMEHTTTTINGLQNQNIDKNINFIANEAATPPVSPFYLYAGTTGAYEYTIGDSASGTCEVVDNPQNCALFRGDNATVATELVRGVNDMQVEYGWVDAAGNLHFDSSPSATEKPFVDRMKITMTFNSINNVASNGSDVSGLIFKTVSRTFNLYNQL